MSFSRKDRDGVDPGCVKAALKNVSVGEIQGGIVDTMLARLRWDQVDVV